MKKIFLILILTSAIGYSQTKEETIDWLNNKFEEYTDTFMGKFEVQIIDDENYGELLYFKQKTRNPLSDRDMFEHYSFLPNAISSIIVSTKIRTNNTLDIFIISKDKRIWKDGKKFVSEVTIPISKLGQNEMTERIQKGLLHLLKLMGNDIKPEKDFFKN